MAKPVVWFACDNIDTPACCRIWPRVILATSAAKSVSMMRERAADTFSEILARFEIVLSIRFWIAPRSARMLEICEIAASMIDIAVFALLAAVSGIDS